MTLLSWSRLAFLACLMMLSAVVAFPRAARAQSCGFATQVSPCSTTFDAIPSTQQSAQFTVKNNLSGLSGAQSYNFTCGNYGSLITSCSVSPTSAGLSGGQQTTVTMTYTTNGTVGKTNITFSALSNKPGDSLSVVNTVTTTYLTTSSKYTNQEEQSMPNCAAACFRVAYSQSTVPYISLGVPRIVTLHYDGDRVALRPIVRVFATLASGAPTVSKYQLQVKVNGTLVTFINGETTLNFAGNQPSSTVLLVGAFDGSGWAEDPVPMQVITTVVYPTYQEQVVDSSHRLVVYNERLSQVARGWTIAGVTQRFWYWDATQNLYTWTMAARGEGSLEAYGPVQCFAWGCSWAPPFGATDTAYYYNSGGHQIRYADSSRELYNAAGNITARIGRLQDTVAFGYDSQNRVISISDPFRMYNGAHTYTILRYNSYGLSQIQEPGPSGPGTGRLTTYTVASDSTLRTITDPDGLTTQFTYDASRRLSQVVDRNGDTTRYVYTSDSTWKLATFQVLHMPIDIGGGSTKDSTLSTVLSTWQTLGLPLTPTASNPPTPLSQIYGSVTDPAGLTTSITPDWRGAIQEVTNAIGQGTSITESDSNPNPLASTSPTGGVLSLTFQGPLLVSSQNAGMSIRSLVYTSGHTIPDSGSGGNAVAFRRFLGQYGRLDSIRVAGNVGRVTHYTYDSYTRVTSIRDPLGHTTSYFYDPVFGNLDSTVAPGNRYSVTHFDSYGRDSVQRANGTPWRTKIYDAMNRLIQYYDGVNANPSTFTYSGIFATRATDPYGHVYRRINDPHGNVTTAYDMADTLNTYRTYRRNADGLVTSSTNRRGQLLQVTYDGLNRIASKSGTGTVTASFGHNLGLINGEVEVWSTPASTDSMFHDQTGFLDSIVTHRASNRFVVHYTPDSALRVATTTITSNTNIAFVTRHAGRNDTTLTVDTLQLNGRSGLTTTFKHDLTFRIIGSVYPGLATPPQGADSATALQQQYRAEIQNAGSTVDNAMAQKFGSDSSLRVNNSIPVNTTLNEWANTQYRYDFIGRLTSIRLQDITPANFASTCQSDTTNGFQCTAAPTAGDTISYDAANNITCATLDGSASCSTVGAGNHMTAFRGVSYTFDKDGNVTSSGSRQFFWSAEGALDSVVAGTVVLFYEYDGLGRLVRRSRNGVVERNFLWDGEQLLAELDGTASNRIAEYVYVPDVNRPFALISGDTTVTKVSYFHQDRAIGNVVGLFRSDSGASATLQEQYAYDELGANSTVVDSSLQNRLLWKGLIWEGDSTRLYYVRSRWYDPVQGRFMNEDPDGIGASNQYVFAYADPINGVDHKGREDDALDDPGDDCDDGCDPGGFAGDATQTDGSDYGDDGSGADNGDQGPDGSQLVCTEPPTTWTHTPPNAPGVWIGMEPLNWTALLGDAILPGEDFEAGHGVIEIFFPDGSVSVNELQPVNGLFGTAIGATDEVYLDRATPYAVSQGSMQPSDFEWTQVGGIGSIPAYVNATQVVYSAFEGQVYAPLTDNSNTYWTDVVYAAGQNPPPESFWFPLTPVGGCWAGPCGHWIGYGH